MVKMGTVWDRTAEFLTDNLTAIVPIALLAFFVPLSIQGNFAHVSNAANAEPALVVTLAILGVGFAVLVMWGSLTLIAMTFADRLGAGPQPPSTIATRRLVPALLVWLALFVVIIGLPGLVIGSLGGPEWQSAMLGASALANRSGNVADIFRTGLVFYVLLISLPLLLLTARLILVSPVIVREAKWFGAIRRSFLLTRGLTLSIFGVMLLYALVSNVAVLATQTVFGSIFELVAGAPNSPVSLSLVLTSVMVAAVQTGFTVIGPVFTANLYLALTQREAAAAA